MRFLSLSFLFIVRQHEADSLSGRFQNLTRSPTGNLFPSISLFGAIGRCHLVFNVRRVQFRIEAEIRKFGFSFEKVY